MKWRRQRRWRRRGGGGGSHVDKKFKSAGATGGATTQLKQKTISQCLELPRDAEFKG